MQNTKIVDVDIPFGRLVSLHLTVGLAAIVAGFCLAIALGVSLGVVWLCTLALTGGLS